MRRSGLADQNTPASPWRFKAPKTHQHSGEIDEAAQRLDPPWLHAGDLVLAQRFAHDVESADKRRLTKRPHCTAGAMHFDGSNQRLRRLIKSAWGVANAADKLAMNSLARCMAALRDEEVGT